MGTGAALRGRQPVAARDARAARAGRASSRASSLDLVELDDETDAYTEKVEAGLADRPDVAELVRAIEDRAPRRLPSGDELAAEIERFLREQSAAIADRTGAGGRQAGAGTARRHGPDRSRIAPRRGIGLQQASASATIHAGAVAPR